MTNDLAGKHIDQLYSRLEAVWEWRSRSILALVTFSALLLAVVAGAVQAPAEFAGIRIVPTVAGKAFIVLAMFGISAVGVALNAMDLRSDALVRRLLQLYVQHGYDECELTEWGVSPLSSHHPMLVVVSGVSRSGGATRSKMAGLYDAIGLFVIFIAVMLLPAAATVVGGLWLVQDGAGSAWSVALALLCTIVAVANPIVGVARGRHSGTGEIDPQ